MNTETIDLNIGGVDFSQCIVDFEYEPSDKGSSVQPTYDEDVTVYRVQVEMSECGGFDVPIWCDLQSIHFHLVEKQVLDWIHEQQEYRSLEIAINKKESRESAAMENEDDY